MHACYLLGFGITDPQQHEFGLSRHDSFVSLCSAQLRSVNPFFYLPKTSPVQSDYGQIIALPIVIVLSFQWAKNVCVSSTSKLILITLCVCAFETLSPVIIISSKDVFITALA